MVRGRKTRGRVEESPSPYSQNKELLALLWTKMGKISTSADFSAFCIMCLDPQVSDILILATTFFSQSKVWEDGRRDGKKIYQHIQLGFGERLTAKHHIGPKILRAMGTLIVRTVLGEKKGDLRRELRQPRFHAHAVALDVLNLMCERMDWGDDPPKLPIYLR